METEDGGRAQTGKSTQTKPRSNFRESAGVQSSLLPAVARRHQVVIIRETQVDVGTAERGWQRLKRRRGTNRRYRGAIQRLFARTGDAHWLAVGNDSIPHNAELQCDNTFVAEPDRFGHHCVPVSLHDDVDAAQIVVEVHSLCRSEHLNRAIGLSLAAAATKPTVARDLPAAAERRRRAHLLGFANRIAKRAAE